MSSSRFPGKMLENISGLSLIEYVYNRCKCSIEVDSIVVLTSTEKSDDVLYDECIKHNISVYRGDLNNVLQRYIDAAEYFDAELICRVCGDSPFVDIEMIDEMFRIINKDDYEYVSFDGYCNGFKSEVFSINTLNKISELDIKKEDKEHVTKYLIENKELFNIYMIDNDSNQKNISSITLTVDYPEDINIANKVAKKLSSDCATTEEIVSILEKKL